MNYSVTNVGSGEFEIDGNLQVGRTGQHPYDILFTFDNGGIYKSANCASKCSRQDFSSSLGRYSLNVTPTWKTQAEADCGGVVTPYPCWTGAFRFRVWSTRDTAFVATDGTHIIVELPKSTLPQGVELVYSAPVATRFRVLGDPQPAIRGAEYTTWWLDSTALPATVTGQDDQAVTLENYETFLAGLFSALAASALLVAVERAIRLAMKSND